MLGSTTTASVCNTHTTGNMMIVAAGGTKGGRLGMSFSTALAMHPCGFCANRLTNATSVVRVRGR